MGLQQRFYIAAQSPLPATVATFWQMVWEADVYLVASLIAPGEEIASYLPIAQHAGQVSLTWNKFYFTSLRLVLYQFIYYSLRSCVNSHKKLDIVLPVN